MPNALQALCLLRGHCDDLATIEFGGIHMRRLLGKKPLGQGISQTERAQSFRNAVYAGFPWRLSRSIGERM